MAEDHVDPELQALTDRIDSVRAAIVEEKAARAKIERTQSPGDDGPEQALAAVRDEITAARARLAALETGGPAKRVPTNAMREAAARRAMYIIGAAVASPGVVTLGAMLSLRGSNPSEAIDPMAMLIFAAPLLVGLAFVARGRFANYRADRDDLDGDFLP